MSVAEFTSAESLRQHRDSWEKILRRLRAGEMPPPEDNGVSYIKIPINKL